MYIGDQMFISFLVLFETLHFSAKQRRVLYKYKVIGQQCRLVVQRDSDFIIYQVYTQIN